jgi:ribonuclease HI
MTATLILYADGLCQPKNPGGCGCWGWWAADSTGAEIAAWCGALGCEWKGAPMTNNIAEYVAAWKALRWAQSQGLAVTLLRSDSQLVVNQIEGAWRCNGEILPAIRQHVWDVLDDTGGSAEWIRRELNERADELSRLAFQEWRRGRKAPFALEVTRYRVAA